MAEARMSDGLVVDISRNPVEESKLFNSTTVVYRCISIAGGPAGFIGYGASASEAIADMYRTMRDNHQKGT